MTTEHPDARLTMARAFEEGAIAITGRAARTNAAGTIVPVRVRVTGLGESPFFALSITSEADGMDLLNERVFALDGVIARLMDAGEGVGTDGLPAVWETIR
jgi:hypothetical protein